MAVVLVNDKKVCWIHAHDAVRHTDGSVCTCRPDEIYPADERVGLR